MELKKCPEGHYYDASIYSECPTCKEAANQGGNMPSGSGTVSMDTGHTLPMGSYGATAPVQDGYQATAAGRGGYGATAPVQGGYGAGGQGGYGATAPVQSGYTAPVQSGYTAPVQSGYTAPIQGGYTAPLTGGQRRVSDEGQTVAVVHQMIGIDPVVGWLVSINGSEKGRDYRIHSDNNFIGRSEKMDICIRGDDTISRVNHAVVAYDMREKIFYFAPGEGRSINRINGKAILGMTELHAYDEIEIGQTKLVFIPLCGERFEWSNEDE